MPHMSSGGSEDFYSTDEVKVYKDEGNKDEEKRSSENLTEEKLGLVTESEEGKGNLAGPDRPSNAGDDDKSSSGPAAPGQGPPSSMGFFLPPYASPYPNGSSVGKFGIVQPPYPGLVMYNEFAQPPPAHKGYPPVYTDPKTGLPRPPMYAAYPAPGQFPHPLYSPEFTSASWHRPGYPLTSGAFAASFPPSLSSLSRYGPPGLLSHPGLTHPGHHHPGIPHPASLGGPGAAGPHKGELLSPQLLDSHSHQPSFPAEPPKKKNHIKKPLNAFMLFMKEQRPKVIAECTLRESSAINQILGRRWHALDRAEQAKYYEMARKEKELHLQLYPGWSARDNYAAHQKKKKRKKDGGPECGSGGGCSTPGMLSPGGGSVPGGPMGAMGAGPMGGGPANSMGGGAPHHLSGSSIGGAMGPDSENKPGFPFSGECPNEKKCRARYGMEQQSRWCKPCRRKKKCIRYKQFSDTGGEGSSGTSAASGGADESISSRARSNSHAEMDEDEDTDSDLHNGSLTSGHHRLQQHRHFHHNHSHNNSSTTLDSSIFSGCESDSTPAGIPRSMDSPGHPSAKIARLHEASMSSLHRARLHNGDSVNGHRKGRDLDCDDGQKLNLVTNGDGDDMDSDRISDPGSPLSPIVDEKEDNDVFKDIKPFRRQSGSERDPLRGEENHKSQSSSREGSLSASASASLSALSLARPPSLLSSGAAGLSLPPSPFIHSHHPLGMPPSPSSSALTSSPLPPPRRLTPHSVDSFLFSPPPLRLPAYPLPPSPLAAMPMPYYGLAPFHHPHFLPPPSPHNPSRSPPLPSPQGSPFSVDIKPAL